MGATLLIVRHAQSVANVKNILAGRFDPTPLSEAGVDEARRLTPVLAEFQPQLILSSPLLRCRQTVAEAGVLDPVLDERLIEMDYGQWTGRKIKGLALTPSWKRIQQNAQSFVFPRGEGFVDAEERIRDLLNELQNSEHQRIALFTHGDIARIMINQLLGRELNAFQRINIATGSHSKMTMNRATRNLDGESVIHYINRREHRPQTEGTAFKVGGE